MNMAVDMSAFIAPKSDQLNADDLLAGPRTITVTGVRANAGSVEQPICISFDGDNGKPYMPCKSMRRVMVTIWGANAAHYVGRSMTLYCDPSVQFSGMKVGGIRISHMSHMESSQTMALTATRAKRAAFTVQPLQVVAPVNVSETLAAYDAATTAEKFDAAEKLRKDAWPRLSANDKAVLKAKSDEVKALIAAASKTEGTK